MMESNITLPPEVWTNVFGYLSTADRSSVRASCKYFNKLVDHWSLWRGWSVVLNTKTLYNRHFLSTLRRRRVSSVLVRSSSSSGDKKLQQIASSLPEVSTVVMEHCPAVKSSYLQMFLNLRRLAIRDSCISQLLIASAVCRPELLTHLSICGVKTPTTFSADISPFTNLVSLVHHESETSTKPFQAANFFRVQHPKLKHLSLSSRSHFAHPAPEFLPQEPTGASLSSFELVCAVDYMLHVDAMKTMPDVKSLAVFYRESSRKMQELLLPFDSCMARWLRDLCHLTTLTVVEGPQVKTYASFIPATVTSLTLCVRDLSLEDMEAMALQVPNLQHLHIDPWPCFLGTHTAKIPQLFPKLRTLKLCHEHVPEEYFLQLHRLQDLETLEVLDSRPQFSELAEKLRALTNYRLRVIVSRPDREVMSCPCVSQVY